MLIIRTPESDVDVEEEEEEVDDVQAIAITESATASSSAEGSKKIFWPTDIAMMMTGGFSTALDVLDLEFMVWG